MVTEHHATSPRVSTPMVWGLRFLVTANDLRHHEPGDWATFEANAALLLQAWLDGSDDGDALDRIRQGDWLLRFHAGRLPDVVPLLRALRELAQIHLSLQNGASWVFCDDLELWQQLN